jgi:CAP12/Pycsar effector protein, TIR domain
MSRLPSIFIGCSVEAKDAAEALQNNLRYDAFAKIWWQNTFRLTEATIESLLREAPTYDFAIFILSADDVRNKRGTSTLVPRDNVIFETGLFMGVLGRDRVYLVKRRDIQVELPTDLLGITPADYIKPPHKNSGDWEAALGPASRQIKDAIKRLKLRTSAGQALKTSEAQLKNAAQFFHKLLKDRYGVSAAINSIRAEITDWSGSATIRRGLRDIKVAKKGGVKIDKIAGMVAPGAPGGKITRYPAFVELSKFSKEVKIKTVVKRSNYYLFDIEIAGSLTQYDSALSFEHESRVTKFCLMTKEEVEQAYRGKSFPYEYVALRIEMPTDKTLIEVVFPEGYSPTIQPGVFFGESESLHDSELYRVRRGFRKVKRGARFAIIKPLVGFNYLIYWTPPMRKSFDKLRGSK